MRMISARLACVVFNTLLIGALPSHASVVHVSTGGDDGSDGSSWAAAKRTIESAIIASESGDEIWVAAGIYYERISLKVGQALYGGFAGNETSFQDRPPFPRTSPDSFETIIDGSQSGTVIAMVGGGTSATRLDGFTIRNGKTTYGGGGINCYYGSPIICNNIIMDNTAEQGGGLYIVESSPEVYSNTFTNNRATPREGGAIYCSDSLANITNNTMASNSATLEGGAIYCWTANPTISANTITNNTAAYGGGIHCSYSFPVITFNQISGNSSTGIEFGWGGGGVSCYRSSPMILNNFIFENLAPNAGGILAIWASDPIIANNLIVRNSATDGGGISSTFNSSPTIANNTIAANIASAQGGGVDIYSSSVQLYGNIVAFNSSGIHASLPEIAAFFSNCIYGNSGYDYSGVADPTGTNGNVMLDPSFVDRLGGDFHLTDGSACIDAGSETAVQSGWFDIDGQPRTEGVRVDIGADEFVASNIVSDPVFDVASGTYSSPVTVNISCETEGAIVTYTTEDRDPTSDDPVAAEPIVVDRSSTIRARAWKPDWDPSNVATAQYIIRVLYVSPDGDDNNDGSSWQSAKRTVQSAINASVPGCEVWVASGSYQGTVTVRSGVSLYGGFARTETERSQRLWITNSTTLDGEKSGSVMSVEPGSDLTTVISGFIITDGSGTEADNGTLGGGIYCRDSSPTLSELRIISNAAGQGGGIYCDNSSPHIVNCDISGNSSGVYCVNSSQSKLVNSTVTANDDTGVYSFGSSSVQIVNSIIAFNGYGISVQASDSLTIRNSCCFGNTGGNYIGMDDPTGEYGNISIDPLLADGSRDYHLLVGSPCVDAGTPEEIPSTDLDGGIRTKDGNGDGTATVDMGCYECPSNYGSIAGSKSLPDGVPVGTYGVVSAIFPGRFYVESSDRISGIGTLGTAASVGKRVIVEGIMTTVEGERLIQSTSLVEGSSSPVPSPYYLGLSALGGGPLGLQEGVNDWRVVLIDDEPTRVFMNIYGANNIGLLVKVSGIVNFVGDGFFYVDDSALFDDGDQDVHGVMVDWIDPAPAPVEGNFVIMTGISSCAIKDGYVVRMLRPTSIEVVSAPNPD